MDVLNNYSYDPKPKLYRKTQTQLYRKTHLSSFFQGTLRRKNDKVLLSTNNYSLSLQNMSYNVRIQNLEHISLKDKNQE
jgi:hypothetical protein